MEVIILVWIIIAGLVIGGGYYAKNYKSQSTLQKERKVKEDWWSRHQDVLNKYLREKFKGYEVRQYGGNSFLSNMNGPVPTVYFEFSIKHSSDNKIGAAIIVPIDRDEDLQHKMEYDLLKIFYLGYPKRVPGIFKQDPKQTGTKSEIAKTWPMFSFPTGNINDEE